MQLKFKNGDIYDVKNLLEQKAYKGTKDGWMISFTINGHLNSNVLENLTTSDNISILTVIGDDSNTTVITGYDKVTSLIVRHNEIGNETAEIQLTKGL